jgi:hypothetical protein
MGNNCFCLDLETDKGAATSLLIAVYAMAGEYRDLLAFFTQDKPTVRLHWIN